MSGGGSAFAAACRRPFSNGTEGEAWMAKWCNYCTHDHDMSHRGGTYTYGCSLVMASMVDEWPDGWVPEPDDGRFSLPSRLICTRFEPCVQGECSGDPGEAERAERVATVIDYWRQRESVTPEGEL